jgi:autotransporter-associated beta strand protein
VLGAAGLLLVPGQVWAQDATWLQTPGSGDFNTGTNWSSATVPTGTAFFGASATTLLGFSAATTIGGWTFNPGAANYQFYGSGQSLSFDGAGIVINGGSANISGFGSGSITFNNSSTASSATVDRVGSLIFNGSSTAGSANIGTGGGGSGVIIFNNSSSAGGATLTAGSGGSLVFNNASTAGNATITSIFVVNFNDSSTAGSATIRNYSGGFLIFDDSSTAGGATITSNSSTVIISGTASGGTARFILNGGGKLDFSELMSAGTTAGSIEGDGGVFLGGKNLTVGGNNLSTTFSGIVQDGGSFGGVGGSLAKVGTGTLTLTNTNTYTGATTITSGALQVDGSIATSSLTTVNSGGTLDGIGAVGNTQINSGGTFAPGASGIPGTSMTVSGNLALQSGAAYLVQISPTTTSFASVTAAATLGGATVNAIFANGTYVSKQYTILTAAGGVSGTFNSLVSTNLPVNFLTGLSYDANDAYLNLALDYSTLPGLGGNQQNVGKALVNFFNTTGGIPTAFGALAAARLTQASGEVGTGTQQTTFAAMTQFLNILLDPFVGGRSDPTAPVPAPSRFADDGDPANAYASTSRRHSASERDAYRTITKAAPRDNLFDPHWSIWAAGFGGSETTNGNAATGSNNTTSRVFGTAVGADYLLSPRTISGFSLAGGGTNFSVANGGAGRSDLFQAGAFVRHDAGSAYLSGALAYGWQNVTTNRNLTIAGIDQLQANFDSNALSGRVEGGYRFATPLLVVTPYAAAQFTNYNLPAYAEQVLSGANTFALGYAAKDITASRSELGVRTDKAHALTNAVLMLRGRLAWAHNFNTDPNIAPTFQTLPGASFVVNGAAQAHDAALTTASAELKWRNGVALAATFEGEFSSTTTSYAGKGVARYEW